MFDLKTFAGNVHKFRLRQHMTQTQIAKRLFVTPQTVSKWENAEAAPDLYNLCNLAQILNVSVGQLLGEETGSAERRVMIGLDGGNTRTELCLFSDDGRVLNHLTLGGTNPNTVGLETACQILQLGIDQLMSIEAGVQGLFGGFAGVESENNRRALSQFLRRQYPRVQSFVDSDIQNVLHSVRGLDRCVAVICGSGVVVFGAGDGALRRAGGYGHLLDDGGSSYHIGHDVLRACLMMDDGILQPSLLLQLAEKKLGGSVRTRLDWLYARGVEYIASYAPLAFDAYAQGDAAAEAILRQNFERLSKLILHVRASGDYGESVILGGELTVYRDVLERFLHETLGTGTKLIFPELPPVYGACVHCCELCGVQTDAAFDENFRRTLVR